GVDVGISSTIGFRPFAATEGFNPIIGGESDSGEGKVIEIGERPVDYVGLNIMGLGETEITITGSKSGYSNSTMSFKLEVVEEGGEPGTEPGGDNQITVTFNTPDSNPQSYTLTTSLGGTIGEIPEPNREDYDFLGWYYDLDGAEIEFTSETILDKDLTVYARWEEIVSDPEVTELYYYGDVEITEINPSSVGYSEKEIRPGYIQITFYIPHDVTSFSFTESNVAKIAIYDEGEGWIIKEDEEGTVIHVE
ncbi:MAG: InlB B-repeat-containing protein, partial [Tissierellaceae bacterium]|nr:InlB B-repeat-containing protein [Tissierellaceae bacterium]